MIRSTYAGALLAISFLALAPLAGCSSFDRIAAPASKPASYEQVEYERLQSGLFLKEYHDRPVWFKCAYMGQKGSAPNDQIYFMVAQYDFAGFTPQSMSQGPLKQLMVVAPKNYAELVYGLPSSSKLIVKGRMVNSQYVYGYGGGTPMFLADEVSVESK